MKAFIIGRPDAPQGWDTLDAALDGAKLMVEPLGVVVVYQAVRIVRSETAIKVEEFATPVKAAERANGNGPAKSDLVVAMEHG